MENQFNSDWLKIITCVIQSSSQYVINSFHHCFYVLDTNASVKYVPGFVRPLISDKPLSAVHTRLAISGR